MLKMLKYLMPEYMVVVVADTTKGVVKLFTQQKHGNGWSEVLPSDMDPKNFMSPKEAKVTKWSQEKDDPGVGGIKI